MNPPDDLLAHIDQLRAQNDYDLSPIGAAILIACAHNITADSRDFAKQFGLAHALIIRECATLCNELGLIDMKMRNARSQNLHYRLTKSGRALIERIGYPTHNDMMADKQHPPIKQVEAIGWDKVQAAQPLMQHMANEVPVSMVFNGSSMAVMMATPLDLKDFAYGFAISEGFIISQNDVERFELQQHQTGIEAQFWLQDMPSERLDARRRQLAGPIGCGLCGLESIEQAMRDVPNVTEHTMRLTHEHVHRAITALSDHQALHDQTSAMHAAGFFTERDGMLIAREDVGRHNALDKVIGRLHLNHGDLRQGAIVITSRLSLDLVQKTAMAGVPMIIAASAPTAAAIELAVKAGITLVGLARHERFHIFTHAVRIETQT